MRRILRDAALGCGGGRRAGERHGVAATSVTVAAVVVGNSADMLRHRR